MRVMYRWGSVGVQQRLAAALLAFFASMMLTGVASAAGFAVVVMTSSLPAATVGVHYTAPPLSARGGRPPYTFAVTGLPTGLTYDGVSGVISGRSAQSGSYTLVITATDSARRRSLPKRVTLIVKAPPLTLTTASLASGSWEKAYHTSLAAKGGTQPYTFTASGLPNGLTASGSAITGKPTQAGTFNVSITVTDSTPAAIGGPYRSTKQFRLIVSPPTVTVTTASLRPGKQGQSYSTPLAASGGAHPYTFTAAGLPRGLAVNGSAITGVPEQAGTFYVRITAIDHTSPADGGPFRSSAKSFTLQISKSTCVSPPCPHGTS